MIAWLLTRPPLVLRAGGMALVAGVLLVSSLVFGAFDSNYDLNGPYDHLYPTGSPTEQAP
jgi:hypothetical protein